MQINHIEANNESKRKKGDKEHIMEKLETEWTREDGPSNHWAC